MIMILNEYEEDFPYDDLIEEHTINQLLEQKENDFFNLSTKDLIKLAKTKGISIKLLSKLTNISANTLYNFNCGYRNLSSEKEEKIRNMLYNLLEDEFRIVTKKEVERQLNENRNQS